MGVQESSITPAPTAAPMRAPLLVESMISIRVTESPVRIRSVGLVPHDHLVAGFEDRLQRVEGVSRRRSPSRRSALPHRWLDGGTGEGREYQSHTRHTHRPGGQANRSASGDNATTLAQLDLIMARTERAKGNRPYGSVVVLSVN